MEVLKRRDGNRGRGRPKQTLEPDRFSQARDFLLDHLQGSRSLVSAGSVSSQAKQDCRRPCRSGSMKSSCLLANSA